MIWGPFQNWYTVCQNCFSVAKSCLTLCDLRTAAHQASQLSPGVCSNSCTLSQWCHSTILSVAPVSSCPPSFPASGSFPMSQSPFRIRWPKYWSFSFSTSPSSEYSGLVSFRIDWFDLLAVQGALKSLLQRHSSKGSILRMMSNEATQKKWDHFLLKSFYFVIFYTSYSTVPIPSWG